MDKIFYPLQAALAAIALAYKIPALVRDPRSPSRRALVAMLACLVWAPAFDTPVIYLAFDRLTGVANLARLIAHFGIIGFAVSVQILLLHWTVSEPRPSRTWRRLASVTVTAVAMTVLFTLAPVDESTTEFTVRYGDAPYVAPYMVVYLGYFIFALVDIIRLSWRYARLTQRPFLRLGLRLVTFSAGFGVVYCVEKAAYISARAADLSLLPAPVQESVGPVITAAGSVLMLIGFTIPSWGPKLASAAAWVKRYVTFRRLQPLWLLVYDATPEIALEPTRGAGLRDLEYQLVRRIVEIRDGWLALRPYLDHDTAQLAGSLGAAADLSADRLRASVSAAVLTEAARAKGRGETPRRLLALDPSGGSDIADETAELLRIAAELTSPVVRQTLSTRRSGPLPQHLQS